MYLGAAVESAWLQILYGLREAPVAVLPHVAPPHPGGLRYRRKRTSTRLGEPHFGSFKDYLENVAPATALSGYD
ncbi:hypothetical protein ACHAPT_003556 [Fusarium lateritium]